MECWQLQFNRVEEERKLNISFKDKFSSEIKFNWLMRKKMKAKKRNENENRETAPYLEQPGHHYLHLRTEQHKLAAQKTFFPNLASRQMKTKLYFSS